MGTPERRVGCRADHCVSMTPALPPQSRGRACASALARNRPTARVRSASRRVLERHRPAVLVSRWAWPRMPRRSAARDHGASTDGKFYCRRHAGVLRAVGAQADPPAADCRTSATGRPITRERDRPCTSIQVRPAAHGVREDGRERDRRRDRACRGVTSTGRLGGSRAGASSDHTASSSR